uniref:Fibronectin type-III domain-containing protein n=1 Tax=Anopheles culicifacies TaxID=139723 RepID=A0A182M9B1_9DIPT
MSKEIKYIQQQRDRRIGKDRSVPGAPPRNVTVEATSPTTINVSWLPPPVERSNGAIVYYKVFFVEVGRSDSEATVTTLNSTSIVLDELKRWTEYKIWVLAGTSVGDGPRSYPYTVRTHEDAPQSGTGYRGGNDVDIGVRLRTCRSAFSSFGRSKLPEESLLRCLYLILDSLSV